METAYHADSKVTDCHAMRGTRSSGDDIREGDALLEVAMDDDEDLYAGCRTRGIPSLPKVELKGFQDDMSISEHRIGIAEPLLYDGATTR